MLKTDRWTHDCDRCEYLGTGSITGQGLVDVYWCPETIAGQGSAVLRYGSDGPEYWSMPLEVLDQVTKADPLIASSDSWVGLWASMRTQLKGR